MSVSRKEVERERDCGGHSLTWCSSHSTFAVNAPCKRPTLVSRKKVPPRKMGASLWGDLTLRGKLVQMANWVFFLLRATEKFLQHFKRSLLESPPPALPYTRRGIHSKNLRKIRHLYGNTQRFRELSHCP